MAHSHTHDHDCGHTHDHAHGHDDSGHDHVWTRGHMFLGAAHARAENRALIATGLTAIFMVVEIVAGIGFGSMALLADGIHMATHVAALGLAALAYWLARRHADSRRFTFGSGKFGDLAAFASALLLGATAIAIGIESIGRFFTPQDVRYGDALLVAAIGLIVNLVCALILKGGHDHHHHGHDHGGGHGQAHDNNMRAAYLHVLADAGTSVAAIGALAGAFYLGWGFLDPLTGLLGAGVIAIWAYGLIRDSGLVLLDAESDPVLADDIRATIEKEGNARVADLHLWRLGPGHQGLIVSLVSPDPAAGERVKAHLRRDFSSLSHVTVEVAICTDCT